MYQLTGQPNSASKAAGISEGAHAMVLFFNITFYGQNADFKTHDFSEVIFRDIAGVEHDYII